VSNDGVLFDSLNLVDGVIYLGGYSSGDFSNATRALGSRSRIAGRQVRRVITAGEGVSDTTLVDFFDISGGLDSVGAGVFLYGDAAPVFTNCGFLDNRAFLTGAALWAQDEAAPTLRNCVIFENTHDDADGALIHLAGGGGTFVNNTISNNQGNGRGFLIENCAPVIYNNAITFNDHGVRSINGAGTVFDHNNVFHNRIDMDVDFEVGQGNISDESRYCDRHSRLYTLFDHSSHLRAGRDGAHIGALGTDCSTPIHFVDGEGSNEYPYSTRQTAAHSIQDAIDVAEFAGKANADSTDEVRVRSGTYQESIVLHSNVKLIGGFSANFLADAQNPDSNQTIIQGLGDGPVVTIDSGVIGITPVRRSPDATNLEGFVIQDGVAERGGGVFIGRDGSPTVQFNRIRDNSAEKGGGIYSANGATPLVRNNLFLRNSADAGAGVYVDTVAAPTTAIYELNTFYDNTAGSDSAGIFHTDGALVWFQENLVTFSKAGKAYSTRNEEPANVNHNLFYGNPGGDTLDPGETSVQESGIFQIVADPEFCDTAAGRFSVFYDLHAIQDSTSALQDSCAETWWGARGADCTKPGHRFLVRQQQASVGERPVFPHVCKENAALTLDEVIDRVNYGDTVEVARSNEQDQRERPHMANMSLNRPILLRGGRTARS